ncbi:MAG: diacylglycerol kinase family lipid kinase [Bacteroidales bacterium]|nr:diacylglycerol kinase family lipid kinase [Candidatus Cryptobacteroides onthequi]
MPSIRNEWYCIVNPHAGSGKTMPEWETASDILRSKSVPFVEVLTSYRAHATKLAYEAAMDGFRRVMAVGGDGSVHEILNGIMRFCDDTHADPSDFTLTVIPIGSGNDWIKSLGLPRDKKKIISLISAGSFSRQDIVRVETASGRCYMANIGGVGFDSEVCVTVNHQKDQGLRNRFIYLKSLILTILNLKRSRYTVVADGQTVFDGEGYSIAFGNGRYSGGGMRQVPLSEIDDGLLDFMIVPCVSLPRIARELPRLFNGHIDRATCLKMGKCREISVRGEGVVEVDGEVKGALPLHITMTGQQINVLK